MRAKDLPKKPVSILFRDVELVAQNLPYLKVGALPEQPPPFLNSHTVLGRAENLRFEVLNAAI